MSEKAVKYKLVLTREENKVHMLTRHSSQQRSESFRTEETGNDIFTDAYNLMATDSQPTIGRLKKKHIIKK